MFFDELLTNLNKFFKVLFIYIIKSVVVIERRHCRDSQAAYQRSLQKSRTDKLEFTLTKSYIRQKSST